MGIQKATVVQHLHDLYEHLREEDIGTAATLAPEEITKSHLDYCVGEMLLTHAAKWRAAYSALIAQASEQALEEHFAAMVRGWEGER